jgi:hypothetical protein
VRLCIIKPKIEMKVFYFTMMSSGKIIDCRWYINTENLWNESEGEDGSTRNKIVALPTITHGLIWDRTGTQT